MEARAQAKMIRVSPQKARLVVDLVRGKQVKEALDVYKRQTLMHDVQDR